MSNYAQRVNILTAMNYSLNLVNVGNFDNISFTEVAGARNGEEFQQREVDRLPFKEFCYQES